MNLNYSINGVLFSQLGIKVASSEGVVDGLSLKEPFAVDWPDAHGQVVDLSRPRYEAREIRLTCWMVASSADNFLTQQNALLTELVKSGTQRLQFTPVTGKPLVFEVYCKAGVTIKKEWRDGVMIGEFTLILIEPQPVKYVLIGTGGTTATITLSVVTPIKLHWGDGSVTEAVGANQSYSHTYGGSSGVPYYLIIAGELERLTEHSKANLTVLWSRLY
ncbi:hypothetical protein EXU85_20235 [Spirosoma sp. KCTC 42546]|uniref:hypothetical protein n=1 Tax=Spirosoma sp. KCTC 42546 TaxID=2520506 RepID=UPI00115AC6A4|nr:hypothetical protein [Spirosoma sp. KCTC 42546]QDK80808.1 hypothetical protein EXU85_20235 [Spirosoma sp. KCTC 42546]